VALEGKGSAVRTRIRTGVALATLGLGLALSIGASVPSATSSPVPDDSAVENLTPLKDTLPFPVGAAIDPRETSGDASALLLRHFNQFTPENDMKPEAWYDADHQFSPSPRIATLMDFARDNRMRVYGHVLVWHSQIPSWFFFRDDGITQLTDTPADQEILKARLRDHIFAVAKYLSDGWGEFGAGNPIVAFDVVNEVISDGAVGTDGLRRSLWYQILGPQYIDLAFQWADEAFNHEYAAPGTDRPVALFINDYNTERPDKRARYLALIDRLLADGVPIDGIGHQFHVYLPVPVESLADALDDCSGRGLVQAVTEMDVPTGRPEQRHFVEQGHYYQDAFRVFREHADEMFSVTVWGLYDMRSWRHVQGGPLIFDDDLQAKPAYYGIVEGYADEKPLSAFRESRSWTYVYIGLAVAAIAAYVLGMRWWRRRRLTEWKRRRERSPATTSTSEGAVDALSRPLPQKRRRRS